MIVELSNIKDNKEKTSKGGEKKNIEELFITSTS